jgi:hypothetical protein
MASSSNHGSTFMGDSFSFFSSGYDKILEQFFVHMDRQRQCVFACAIIMFNLFHNANKLEVGAS